MTEQNNADVFAKIVEETETYLNGNNLRIALDLLAYLRESGRTWVLSEYHPEFYYMGEMTCLIAYDKGEFDLNAFREKIESAGNRFVYDPSSNWNLCCWQHEDDIYELDSFPVDEDVKEYARANVWKCIRCHTDGGCNTFGGGRRTVFGKEFDNACCNVFQLANPDEKELGYIKKLMELEKHIIANSKKN